VGPAVLWDDPEKRPQLEDVQWQEIEPTTPEISPRAEGFGVRDFPGKRIFDIAFSVLALALTLPLYPFIILAIMIEDGWPPFFTHRRESLGGREFPCLKFRSMRRDAERIKAELALENQADGPQFFIEKDPRLTRVGRFLRATQLDELPQFFNVLLGHMSIVGPRPSPRSENQYCPAWREARLSVRPGITGLWQVRRTRRTGLDFQEWIKFDLEYVEKASWRLDAWIILRTLLFLLRVGPR
jgi:lipopolysaccharide/colanic/teichoic acid biosynthesis glycosyltransferase